MLGAFQYHPAQILSASRRRSESQAQRTGRRTYRFAPRCARDSGAFIGKNSDALEAVAREYLDNNGCVSCGCDHGAAEGLKAVASLASAQTQSSSMGTRFRSGIRQLLAGENMLACTDQALVSAMSFATLILIGNWATLGELGSYAICSSFLALLLAAQDSLITRPYTIHMHTLHQSATDHASSALVLSLLLSLAAVLLITLPIGLFDPSKRGLTSIAWAMAGAIPFVLMREFVRRRAFA